MDQVLSCDCFIILPLVKKFWNFLGRIFLNNDYDDMKDRQEKDRYTKLLKERIKKWFKKCFWYTRMEIFVKKIFSFD